MNNGQIPDLGPTGDPNFRAVRSLYLEDWATGVLPLNETGHGMVQHSVNYGSTALQASYLLNGGALAALPALLTSLTGAGAAAIATAAIPFVVGIVATAVASFSAYLNFQWLAAMYWFDSDQAAVNLRRFYEKSTVSSPDPKKRALWVRLVTISFYIGVVAASVALGAFIWGCVAFIDLARQHENPKHASHPIEQAASTQHSENATSPPHPSEQATRPLLPKTANALSEKARTLPKGAAGK